MLDAARRSVAHRFGVGEHRVENLVHLGAERARATRRAQRRVQHRAALGGVDRIAGEHCIAPRFETAFAGEVDEEMQRRAVDAVLRQIGEHFGRFDAEALEAARIALERVAQVEVATMRFVVAAQCGPGFGLVAAEHRSHFVA